MVDFAMDVHKSLYPDREVPNTLKDKRAEVVENFKKLQGETEPVLKQFIDESTFGSSLQTLQQRTWLIHWSLFVF